MEILYIHVKSKNKIKSQDLNFGSEFIFKYSGELKELNISKNELFIDNFFSNENNDNIERGDILNVTSIIGQNGTGKTSILNLIRENFPKGYNAIKSEMIFALKEDGKITIYYDENILIEKTNATELNISLIKLTQINKVINSKNKGKYEYKEPYSIKDFNNTDFVFFSNIFDGTGGNNINGYRDISTNHLVFNDYRRNIEYKTINLEENRSELETYIFDDIERQLLFINGFKENNIIPFDLPEEIIILLKNDYSNKNFKNYNLKPNTQKKLIEIVELIDLSLAMTSGFFEKTKMGLIYNLFIGFFIEINLSYSNILQTIDEGNNILKFNKEKIDFKTINSILVQFEILISVSTNLERLVNTFKNFKELLNFIYNLNTDNKVVLLRDNFFSFNIKNENIKDFHKFIDIYKNSYIFRPYFNLTWAGISSGEKALLNIYSRLYSLTPNIQRTDGLEKNIIILIDEGDAYLHPEWQKQFVKILIDFIPIIYNKTTKGDKQKIQIIFTTNSPIPASDLLNYNTIFLENSINDKNEKVTIVKDSLNDQKETFAANIHTLLSDSFFVKNGLIGDFASEKLNKTIYQLIYRVDLSIDEREKMRRLIHQIGEPVLKTKLMQMYNDRFNLEIHERLDKIEKHLKL